MDNFIYNAITRYYTALSKIGYYKYGDVFSLMVLCFLSDFVYHDYRGIISKHDYSIIEKALNCLFGSSCLIPYPDYMKKGKLYIGEVTEMSYRLKALEDTEVLKAFDGDDENSDIAVVSEDSE